MPLVGKIGPVPAFQKLLSSNSNGGNTMEWKILSGKYGQFIAVLQ